MAGIDRRGFSRLMGTAAAAALVPGAPLAQVRGLEITAPSSPGSGYDQLARTLQAVLLQEGLATGIEVKNVAGGGGTVGLAGYVTGRKRGPSALVIGFALVGGILTTRAPVSLDRLVPLARLTAEPDLVVVNAKSDIRTMADLVNRLRASPSEVRWAGGSVGGIDHVLVGLIARAAGVDAAKVNYVVHAGGGEVMASVLGGRVTAGLSGPEEFRSQIQAGLLRPLAVSSEERVPGGDVPTLREAGVDVALMNWRGLMGHPDLPPAENQALVDLFRTVAGSAAWREALKARSWQDAYLPGPEFGGFLKEEQARVETALRAIGLVK